MSDLVSITYNLIHDDPSAKFIDRIQGSKLLAAIETGTIDELQVDSIYDLGADPEDVLATISHCEAHYVRICVRSLGLCSKTAAKQSNPVWNVVLTLLREQHR